MAADCSDVFSLKSFSDWSTYQSLQGPVKTQVAGPSPRLSDPVGLGQEAMKQNFCPWRVTDGDNFCLLLRITASEVSNSNLCNVFSGAAVMMCPWLGCGGKSGLKASISGAWCLVWTDHRHSWSLVGLKCSVCVRARAYVGLGICELDTLPLPRAPVMGVGVVRTQPRLLHLPHPGWYTELSQPNSTASLL